MIVPYVKLEDWKNIRTILKQLVESGEMEHVNFNDLRRVQIPNSTIRIREKDVTGFIKVRTSNFRRTWIVDKAKKGLEIILKYAEA